MKFENPGATIHQQVIVQGAAFFGAHEPEPPLDEEAGKILTDDRPSKRRGLSG